MIKQVVIGKWRFSDMDGGPFRVPQSTGRGPVSRSEPTRRQPDEPQGATYEAPKASRPVTETRRETKPPKRLTWVLITIFSIIVLAALGWFTWTTVQNSKTAIDTSKYQAVFFTNGQVYFGKLQSFNGDYMKLTDVYYLQTQTGADSKNPQETTSDQSNVQLIKLGQEIHGPEDQMMIAKDQLLFYENLKPDGKVAQSISTYKK